MRKATMEPCIISTWRALRPSGGRSALTALDTASIPVNDEPPLAKARAMMYRAPKVIRPECDPVPTVPVPGTTCGNWPVSSRTTPVTIMTTSEPANR
jgi:hypothetical protein